MPRKLPNPVVVVPGITATYLRDEYPVSPETVWSVLTKEYDRAVFHPDNPARIARHPGGAWYESQQPARIRSDQIFEIAYSELISELRHNLTDRPDRPVPVYPFGYDWRQPLDVTEAQLATFIEEVIERTCLMRHYDADNYATEETGVNLVGHSMGGMVIAGCLERLGRKARVTKVVTLATPFRGSFEAVLKIATGTADLGRGDSSSRERELARLTPAIYHLIPSCAADTDFAATLPKTYFDTSVWQPSVKETIAEFIRQRGLDPGTARQQQAETLFTSMLDAAKAHRDRLEAFKLSSANLTAADWLCVVGANSKTRVRIPITVKGTRPEFNLDSADRVNNWEDTKLPPDQRKLTGDGTVPFLGAVPGFLNLENLVCVTPDDYGYWEIQDRLVSGTAGFHGILPNMDMLHRMITRHLTGSGDTHGNTWGRPAPGVTKAQWDPPLTLELKA